MAGFEYQRRNSEEGRRPRKRRFTAKQAATRIVALHEEEQPDGGHGCSFSLYQGDMSGADLYAVSPYEFRERRIAGKSVTRQQIEAYVRRHADLLRERDHLVGTWWDPREDVTYLDVSVLVPDEAAAGMLAERHGQKAFFHLKSKKTIDLE